MKFEKDLSFAERNAILPRNEFNIPTRYIVWWCYFVAAYEDAVLSLHGRNLRWLQVCSGVSSVHRLCHV